MTDNEKQHSAKARRKMLVVAIRDLQVDLTTRYPAGAHTAQRIKDARSISGRAGDLACNAASCAELHVADELAAILERLGL